MAILTISREIGSNGYDIGRKVANAMNYHFADKVIMKEILKEYGIARFNEIYESNIGFWDLYDTIRVEAISFLKKVVRALAHKDNIVIMGRGSFAILNGFTDTLNVRIKAPFSVRVQRVMEQERIKDVEIAEDLVKKNDKIRSNFINFSYHVDWNAVDAFDFMIDTNKITPDSAVNYIIEILKTLKTRKAKGVLTIDSIKVDPALDKTISSILKQVVT